MDRHRCGNRRRGSLPLWKEGEKRLKLGIEEHLKDQDVGERGKGEERKQKDRKEEAAGRIRYISLSLFFS